MKQKKLSVTHISYAVSKQTSSFRIHTELAKTINSMIFVAAKSIKSDLIIQPTSVFEKISSNFGIIRELFISKIFQTNKLVYFSFNIGPVLFQNFWISRLKKINNDLIHLHWVGNGFININQIDKMNKPIVITLHDMWFMTGGCHVNLSCDKYLEHCNNCPLFNRKKIFTFDLVSYIFNKKLKIFRRKNIYIIVLSSWMKEIVSKSPIFSNCEITQIPNGIDIEKFKPYDKIFSRSVFNIKTKSKILLFGGISANSDYNKGYDLLCQTLRILKLKNVNIELIIFGNSDNSIKDIEGFKTSHIGSLSDDETLAILYSAADVVLVPSRQESFSQVTLESISCGTPVVAFNYSGPKDIIQHKKNGYLAKPYDANDFANGISWIIANQLSNDDLSINCRNIAINNFNIASVANKHIELYQKVMSSI